MVLQLEDKSPIFFAKDSFENDFYDVSNTGKKPNLVGLFSKRVTFVIEIMWCSTVDYLNQRNMMLKKT